MLKKILLPLILITSLNILYAQSWEELGGLSALNANDEIRAIYADPNGYIYAAGAFTNTNGKYYVAKWDGASWAELGDGANALNANDAIFSICMDENGNLYAAGNFTNANGKNYVAKWDGTIWSELGGQDALNANDLIMTVHADLSGNIYAGGEFTNCTSGYTCVKKWNGTTWSELGSGINLLYGSGTIWKIITDQSGNVYAGGTFVNSNGNRYVAKWDGNSWTELGGTNSLGASDGGIVTLLLDATGNYIYVTGAYTSPNGSYNISYWNGNSWGEIEGSSTLDANYDIESIHLDLSGNLYAAGYFTDANNYSYVAKWDGNSWAEVGSGSNALNANNVIYSTCSDVAGYLYAAGAFTNVDGKQYVAQYNPVTTTATSYRSNEVTCFYPNPSENAITINTNEDGIITIYNSIGEIILTQTIQSHTTLNIGHIDAGMYSVSFIGNNGILKSETLIKK